MRLSIVTTLYRSEMSLREFHQRISVAAAPLGDYEIVYVNDGSPDDSLRVVLELFHEDRHVRVIDLSRNFGHHKAMMTGLAHARGDLVFLIDSDLEEDPELLSTFADALRQSAADVVYGVQQRRRGDVFERWSGWLFFKIFNALSDHRIPANVLTVRLMTKRYVSALLAHRERETTIAGLWAITGYRQVAHPVVKHVKSPTTYSLVHRIDVLVNAITS